MTYQNERTIPAGTAWVSNGQTLWFVGQDTWTHDNDTDFINSDGVEHGAVGVFLPEGPLPGLYASYKEAWYAALSIARNNWCEGEGRGDIISAMLDELDMVMCPESLFPSWELADNKGCTPYYHIYRNEFTLVPNQIVNLTPHDIIILDKNGKEVDCLDKRGEGVARVETIQESRCSLDMIPVATVSYGVTENLPEPTPGTIFLVSMVVAQANPNRKDLLCPDTSPQGCLRDDKGQIVGTYRLVRYAK